MIPVKAKGTKKQQIEEKLDIYPNIATIMLCANPKEGSKMLRLNHKAIELLGLEINNDRDRLAIVRGYETKTTSEEKVFLFVTNSDTVDYVNNKRNTVKKNSAKVNLSTLRCKSTWIYDEIEDHHSSDNFLDDRYFALVESETTKGFFKLQEISLTVPKVEVEEQEIDSLFETLGKNVDVEIHQ
jgi:hypothetical protein